MKGKETPEKEPKATAKAPEEKPKDKVFFIVGVRRSGTSIVRKLISISDEIEAVLFEPHDLWHAVMMMHFRRLRTPAHRQRIDDFRNAGNGKWIGAKFALNPGIDALDWIWLSRVYPEAKFIFVARNEDDCFNSYLGLDKNSARGAIPQHIYSPVFNWLVGVLAYYARTEKKRACMIHFDRLLEDTDKELAKAWKLLDVKPILGMQAQIQEPKNTEGSR